MTYEIDELSTKLKESSLESPTEVPFGLYAYDASNSQLGIPRYLFRIFSERSMGQNDERWIKSLNAKYAKRGNLTDIFDRSDDEVAIALNEHLRRMYGRSIHDPFISWTASLAFALQYAIYKHRKEGLPMEKIHLCVIDTTDFPSGTFVSDLVLMRVYARTVKDDTPVDVPRLTSWSHDGLPGLLSLRKSYYFGEYLAQGQLHIENRSFVVSCDKIMTKDLLRLVPALIFNMKDQSPHLANATLQLRQPFHCPERTRLDSAEDITAIKKITESFPKRWIIVMFTTLLGLYPRRMENLRFTSELLDSLSDETLHKCLSQKTTINTSNNMPEVLQFGRLIDAVYDEYTSRCYATLLRSMRRKLSRIQDSIRSFDKTHKTFRHNSLAMERMELLGKADESWTGDLTQEVRELQNTLDVLEKLSS